MQNDHNALTCPVAQGGVSHKRLGHISKRRIKRLMSDEILETLDTWNNLICVECIKSKLTNKKKIGTERAKDAM
jgi:hypothetical protein